MESQGQESTQAAQPVHSSALTLAGMGAPFGVWVGSTLVPLVAMTVMSCGLFYFVSKLKFLDQE
jgi:hypothetical protein